MTAQPDHRPGTVTLSCPCGAVLDLPPSAAEAARPLFERLHAGHTTRLADRIQTFEAFIAAAERLDADDDGDRGGEAGGA